jgi:hypothetical protein
MSRDWLLAPMWPLNLGILEPLLIASTALFQGYSRFDHSGNRPEERMNSAHFHCRDATWIRDQFRLPRYQTLSRYQRPLPRYHLDEYVVPGAMVVVQASAPTCTSPCKRARWTSQEATTIDKGG